MEEKRTTYTIYEGGEVGEVEINDDVIAVQLLQQWKLKE